MNAAVKEKTVFDPDILLEAEPANIAIIESKSNGPSYESIKRLEQEIPNALPCYDIDALTKHHFCNGLYVRQLDVPAGGVVVGKMHAQENFFLLAKGTMSVWTESGVVTVHAPFMVVTKPGDKRVGFAHTDCVTMNFHPNGDNETDLIVLESRYVIPGEREKEFLLEKQI